MANLTFYRVQYDINSMQDNNYCGFTVHLVWQDLEDDSNQGTKSDMNYDPTNSFRVWAADDEPLGPLQPANVWTL